MGYSSSLHKPRILSLVCLGLSPIDCDQFEIIEEIYQESIGAEDRDSLHRLFPDFFVSMNHNEDQQLPTARFSRPDVHTDDAINRNHDDGIWKSKG